MEVQEIPQIFRKASLKCLSLVARIELKSSVIGQLAGLLAALYHTFSKMDKPLYFADRRDIKLRKCCGRHLCTAYGTLWMRATTMLLRLLSHLSFARISSSSSQSDWNTMLRVVLCMLIVIETGKRRGMNDQSVSPAK